MTTRIAVVTERQARLSPLLGVPGRVAAAVDRALEKDPARRFASMTELLAALEGGPRRAGPPGAASLAADGTRFVGRAAELAQLREWLAAGTRLIAIVGPPGAGKSRLARVAAGRELAPLFPGKLWLVDVGEAGTAADLVHAGARALGASLSIEVGAHASVEPLAAMLAGSGRAALVLDGADRLAARDPAAIARLLELAPGLCVVVTARARLRLRGEHVLELGPLALPAAGAPSAAIEDGEAVALFLDRVRAVRPGYRVDADELARIGELVRLLDGLPLAIELAAARMTVLDAGGLLARLGRPGAAGQGSVDAAIDASWALLAPDERTTLAQCSVFCGDFDLDAAEAVVEIAAELPDVLARLRERSLLAAREPGAAGTLRFFLYRSIREFAAARLDAAGLRGASRRHAQWYATRARVFADAVDETGTAAALAALALERDNLWAIPGRLADTGDIALVGHALLALDPLAHADGSLAVLLAGLTQVLAAAGLPDALRGRLLVARGRALGALGRPDEALADLIAARSTAPEVEAGALLAEAGVHASLAERSTSGATGARLAEASVHASRTATARARERALAARSAAARQPLLAARADLQLAQLERDAGHLAAAATLYEQARIALHAVGASIDAARALHELGLVRAALGAGEAAVRLVADACERLRGAADPRLHPAARAAFAGLVLDLGRAAEARAAADEALALQRSLADRGGEAITRGVLAAIHLDEDDPEAAETAALPLPIAARPRSRLRWLLALASWDRGQADAAADHALHAIADARTAADRLAEGLYAATLAAIEASHARSSEAAQALDEARRALAEPGDELDREAAALADGFDELRRARELALRSQHDPAAQQRARARTRLARVLAPRPAGGPSLTRRSFAVRALARRLYRSLAPHDRSLAWAEALDPDRRALVLDPSGRAVRLPGSDAWIDLGERRGSLRLLAALVEARVDGAAGFELRSPDADPANTELQRELELLRSLGLGDLVQPHAGSYRLDPTLPVLTLPGPP